MITRLATLDDVIGALIALEARHTARRDRRAVFVTVYTLMSQEMKRRIERGAFRDNEWVRRYTIAFANLYCAAHDDFDSGRAVSKAWTIAFETARGGEALVTQDLLLGINAHINHDLALALDEVSIEPDRAARLADHSAVNEVLQALTDEVGRRVSDLYARGLAGVDACAGTLDEAVSNFEHGGGPRRRVGVGGGPGKCARRRRAPGHSADAGSSVGGDGAADPRAEPEPAAACQVPGRRAERLVGAAQRGPRGRAHGNEVSMNGTGTISAPQERVDPDEPAVVANFIAFLKEASRRRHPTSPIQRFDQGLYRCSVEAEFTVLPDLPGDLRVGLFAAPRTYPFLDPLREHIIAVGP